MCKVPVAGGNLAPLQELDQGQHSRRGKSKGESGVGEGPWQPLWAMLGTCLHSKSHIPRPHSVSLSKAVHTFQGLWNSVLISASCPFCGTSLGLSFLFGKIKIKTEMTKNFIGRLWR